MDPSSKSSQTGKSAQSGRGKNKRFWRREEEEALVHALVELSGDPKWKAEGNFKNGYMEQLESMLTSKLPNSGLKVNPHIESKVKWFKDKYNALNDMFATSGFGWDDEMKMLKCERSVYEEYCKKNKNAQGLWRTYFPFLEQLDLVFGPDRANGNVCEDIADAVGNMENEGVDLEINGESDDDESVNQTANPSSLRRPSKRARKEKNPKNKGKDKVSTDEDMTSSVKIACSDLSSYMKDMTSHLSTIASAMTVTQQHEQVAMQREQAVMLREEELLERKKNLLNEVMNISGLTRYEAMMGARMLASDHNNLLLFYQSPDDRWKKDFILGIISNN